MQPDPGDALFQFHVSRAARRRYGFDDSLFGFDGNVVLADFAAARRFAAQLNAGRDPALPPVTPGQVNALGLIDEMLHAAVEHHRRTSRPSLLSESLARLTAAVGADRLDALLLRFVDEFPPPAVDRGELSPALWLSGATDGLAHREAALEELVLLWLANDNPAFEPFTELFDDAPLRSGTAYGEAVEVLAEVLAEEDAPLGSYPSLLAMLRAPALASPGSLDGQLRFIRDHWGVLLGPAVLRLLTSLDLLREEFREVAEFVPGQVEVPVYPAQGLPPGEEPEAPEAYSPDLDWMPRVVLLAKNVYVWLAQLERAAGREIRRLDQVPDAELDRIAELGFTGLWLIGVWERSRASERIKRRMGDHEAVASAYSLQDYVVAADLGGNAAFDDLKRRAWRRGIRMSTDMVPNHVGIDSRWVVEHPDWFVQRRDCPFPTYTFDGPDLSDDERVGIFLEDHYYDRSDAAVVFLRRDNWTGDVRFLYHGNDGTSMPWNDTAQLDYRNPEVREAVIRTILHVARQSPIIRFDAAMTLTKKHFQRLWFPEPGTGGDIPSRAEFGLTREQFDQAMPTEFWREVVDRVAVEAPDTLLLAEAFWLLEGYFVRSLGMHRVYNSAFMNMLRDERNAEYRQLIRNTLEYDPQILKRYVNFMSNPDERTAVDQFGTHDKYFGVATLMATMPGLPMFGHGQVEGFAEKYGMEFRRPRWDEQPNQGLVDRHRRQLAPLLHRRHLFADVGGFRLFDFEALGGGVDENVFAYSNRHGGERSLVVYNNRYGDTVGRVLRATPVAERRADGTVELVASSLGEALGLPDDERAWLVLHDQVSGHDLLRSCRELRRDGLAMQLGAYELRVFTGLREVWDDADGRWRRLAERLAGGGTPDVDVALLELELEDVLGPFGQLLEPVRLANLAAAEVAPAAPPDLAGHRAAVTEDLARLVTAIAARTGLRLTPPPAQEASETAMGTAARPETGAADVPDTDDETGAGAPAAATKPDRAALVLTAWRLLDELAAAVATPGEAPSTGRERLRRWLDEWRFGARLAAALGRVPATAADPAGAADAVRVLLVLEDAWPAAAERGPRRAAATLLTGVLADAAGRRFLGVNRWDDVLWFRGEALEELLGLLPATAAAAGVTADVAAVADELVAAAAASGYRVAALEAALAAAPAAPRPDPAAPDEEP